MSKTARKIKTREEILELSIPLFARYGYDGVTMRDIAATMGLTPAALYYHFPGKENLYLDVVEHAFRERSAVLKEILDGHGSPCQRLEEFVAGHVRLAATDKNFLRLMQWVLLDSDETRLHRLSEQVFKDLFVALHGLVTELDSPYDAHLLAISIIGLVFFHFEAGPSRQFMPGHLPQHDDPGVLAQHVTSFLRNNLGKRNKEDGSQIVDKIQKEGVDMKLQGVKEIARKLGLKTENLKKGELIRSIQTDEGNIPCFGTGKAAECGQSTCCWREGCN